ncbi:MAG: tRNA pseudouridine(55) synthase TruB [Spirochaetaceae bacterium]|nr:tRNA pseudouridine(55) synthase TruB [Spirochaetaceae bacterium]
MSLAFLLLNKIPGITSFGSLAPVKRALASGKVGHTGTLDKFADGLLVVLVGRALKLSSFFTNCNKRYEALVRFGAETDTLDMEGDVVAESPPPSKKALETAIRRFIGPIMQKPPAFSAIHLDGKRACELARSGFPVDMPPRPVTVYELTLQSYEPPLARIGVFCSSGTYVRALARDIAVVAGSRAHLAALTRTESGQFKLADALNLENWENPNPDDIRNALRPIDEAVFASLSIPVLYVDKKIAAAMRQGKPIDASILRGEEDHATHAGDLTAIFCDGSLTALIERKTPTLPDEQKSACWRYVFVV